jgi:hypothetical protein
MKAHGVTFSEAAHMVVSDDTPRWLPALLEWWSQGIRHDIRADAIRPTNAQTKERLEELSAAAALVERELRAPLIRDLLEIAPLGRIRNATLGMGVLDLARRAEFVSGSPLLSRPDGRTKPGRNRTTAPGHFSAKDLCAARVFELWRYFYDTEPGWKSVRAARATEAFWLASGGQWNSFGNAPTGWRHHFETVKANESTHALGRLRAVWRTDIEQAAERGRPPWYLGTYFPPRAA